MAGNAIIGALRIVLGADTAALDKGLKDAQGSLARFSSSMKTVGVSAAAGLTAALAGVGVAVKGALTEADKVGKMAQSIGLPVEELSKLKYAAELSDISMESLGTSMVRLSKNMSAVAGGAAGPAAEAFKALGISVRNTDGTMKSSSVVLSEVADKFAGYEDGANKTALAVALFGKAGAAMIPMLNGGAKALEETKQEAEELGLVISKGTAAAAEMFNDNLTRLTKVMSGVWNQVAAFLAPDLAKLSTILVQLAKDGSLATTAANFISTAFMGLTKEVLLVMAAWQRLGAEWVALKNVFTTTGSISEAWNQFLEAGRETQRVMAGVRAQFENDPLGNVDDALAALGKTTKTVNDNLRAAPALASGAKNALQTFLDSQQKSIAARNAETATIGMEAGALERLKVVQQAELLAAQNKIALTPALNASIASTADAAANAALKLQGMQLIQQNLAPNVLFQQEMEKNRLALDAVGATAEQVGRVQQATAEKYGATWQQVIPSAIGGFQQLATEFGKSNTKMVKIAQTLGVVEATINTYTAFTKALASAPPPLNYVAAAGVLAAGMAKVMAIKSQNVTGMKTGGSFTVPGSGGPDSKRMALDLTPGEQVDIWRPNDGGPDPRGRAGGGSTPVINVALQGFSYSRDQLRDLIEGINAMSRDGYRLQIAPA